MKNLLLRYRWLTLVIAIGFFASCAPAIVTVRPEGPPVIVAPGPPPFVGAIWISGEYRWDPDRRTYIIVPGYWSKPRGVWVSGHWVARRGGWVWVRGHWN